MKGWSYVAIPALDERGESTCPSRWPTATLLERQREVGPYDWCALYMGRPVPRGGAVFEGPETYYEPKDLDLGRSRLYVSCDPAATPDSRSDHSVILTAAVRRIDKQPMVDVLDLWRGHVAVPDLVSRLRDTQRRHGGAVLVESVGAFKAIPQLLRSMDATLRVVEVKVGGQSKFTRSQPAAGLWRAGRIRLPRGASWVPALLQEVALFTGAGGSEQDDQVDALSHLVNHASSGSDGADPLTAADHAAIAAANLELASDNWLGGLASDGVTIRRRW